MHASQKPLGINKAILVGQLVVTIPALLIMIGLIVLGFLFFSPFWYLILAASAIISWAWWAVAVPRWRNWAIQHGCNADELHDMAVATGLEWPRGSIFEKTEIRPKSYVREGQTKSDELNSIPSSTAAAEQGKSLTVPAPDNALASAGQPVKGQPFFIRGVAFLIDNFVSMAVLLSVEFIITFFLGVIINIYARNAGLAFATQKASFILNFILGIVIELIYLVIFTWLSGTTPGKLLSNMRVVTESGERVGFKAALIRSVMLFVDSLFLGAVGFIKMKPPLYQRNGDALAKTIVVEAKDPVVKQNYPAWRFLASSGIFLICSVFVAVMVGASAFGPMQPLVKVPAAQINLQKSDLGELATQKNERNEIPSTDKTVVDVNERYFNFRGHKVISKITVFNYFPSHKNDTLKKADDINLKKYFTDPEIQIEPVSEYSEPSSYRGSIQEFYSPSHKLAGYSAFLLKKNVLVHLVVYSVPNAVNPDEIQQLIEIIFSRIP